MADVYRRRSDVVEELPERELARARGFDVDVSGPARLIMRGSFEFGEDGGSGQGFAYAVDADFVAGFIRAFGASSLREVDGRACWVTHTHTRIAKVEPLFAKDGEPFDVDAWERSRGRPA